MADTLPSKENKWRHYLLIFIVAAVVFWPLTLGIFGLKNDAFIYFLPFRYHISEMVQQGYFPFWDPYLFTGLPLHSDMQSGSWNPLVLIISLFTRYNMQVLQWELLLYIFLAGAGMYRLIRQTGYSARTAVAGAVSYMCCGFITDSGSFIPWITSAAWIPFVIEYYYRLLKAPAFSTSIKLGLFLFLLLAAGYPAFFIYMAYLLFFAFIYWAILNRGQRGKTGVALKYLLYAAILFLLLAGPLLLSFAEFFPYYSRGKGATLEQALSNPFNPFCSITYLLPSVAVRPHRWISTDLAMRNAYVGLFTIIFFIASTRTAFTPLRKFIAWMTVFSFIFSLGDATPLRKWCYYALPYMDSFRHPGIIRLFTSIGIILLAIPAMENLLAKTGLVKTKRVAIFTTLLLAGGIAYCFIKYGFSPAKLSGNAHALKQFLDRLTFSDILIIQGLIQLAFLAVFLLFIRKTNIIFIAMICNSAIFASMALPFTFISLTKSKSIDHYLNALVTPTQPPYPDAIDANARPEKAADTSYRYSQFYKQKIAIQPDVIGPTVSTAYIQFLNDSVLRQQLDKLPFAYISAGEKAFDSSAALSLKKFSPSCFGFVITAPSGGYLNLFQQYHHNWQATVNTQPATVEKNHIAFMRVAVPAGRSFVEFRYSPRPLLWVAIYLSALTMTVMLFYLLARHYKKIRGRAIP